MSGLPDVELVFVSGILNPDVWHHQVKYFDRYSDAEKFGGKKFDQVRKELVDYLDQCENAIVIGAEMGNIVVQEIEEHNSVASTVITGPFDNFPFTGKRGFKLGMKVLRHPKIADKLLFKEKQDYKLVKEFLHSAGCPKLEVYRSYLNKSLRVPVKNSLLIYNQGCRFSSMKMVENLRPNSEIAVLDAGSFSFFEKPQEFNKALHDYLQGRKDLLEHRRLMRSASRNKSLKDFEKKVELER